MKRFLTMATLGIMALSLAGCSSGHDKAISVWKDKYMEKETNAQGYKIYEFYEVFANDSESYGEFFFYYGEMRDVFRLGATFQSFNSDGSVTEGIVYCDFRWGEYQNNVSLYELSTRDRYSDSTIIRATFAKVEISDDRLTGRYVYEESFHSAGVSSSEDEAFLMIGSSFEYGKAIAKKYDLPKFYG